MQCNTIHHNTLQRKTIYNNQGQDNTYTIRHNASRCNTRSDTTHYITIQHTATRYTTIQGNTKQYIPIEDNTIQHSATQYTQKQHNNKLTTLYHSIQADTMRNDTTPYAPSNTDPTQHQTRRDDTIQAKTIQSEPISYNTT